MLVLGCLVNEVDAAVRKEKGTQRTCPPRVEDWAWVACLMPEASVPITLDDRAHDRIVANLGPVLPLFPGILSPSHQTHACMHLPTLEQ